MTRPYVSAQVEDWSREWKRHWQWMPSRSLLASVRAHQRAQGTGLGARFVRWWAVQRHRFWSVVTGADVPLDCRIAGGLLMPHPNGIVVHPEARIGPNCLLFQQVTLGTRDESPGAPTLLGHVDVGAGARILGPVTIGAHAVIGANAVVLCDVPAGATAVGIPARVIEAPLPADWPAEAHANAPRVPAPTT